jgi:hypothetical protein
MKRIFFAAAAVLASNIALALPQENNTPLPPAFTEQMSTLSVGAEEMDMSALDSQETTTSATNTQESNTGTR